MSTKTKSLLGTTIWVRRKWESPQEICKQFLLYLMPEVEGEANVMYDLTKAKDLYDQHTDLIESLMSTMKMISTGSAFDAADDGTADSMKMAS